MAAPYRPAAPFDTALLLLVPTPKKAYGVAGKEFPNVADGVLFFGSFKTYGGTEQDVNGVFSVLDTATIETWYRPDIKSACRVAVASTGAVYEILGEPENINLRNQYLRFKVQRVKGGA